MCFGVPRASLHAGPVFREPNEAPAAFAADFVGLLIRQVRTGMTRPARSG